MSVFCSTEIFVYRVPVICLCWIGVVCVHAIFPFCFVGSCKLFLRFDLSDKWLLLLSLS